jgi:uncharacterized membrane protein YqjE
MYSTEFVPDPEQYQPQTPSLGAALRDVVAAATELLKDETRLARAEILATATEARGFIKKALYAAILVGLSVIPFMAFLVLAIGEYLDGRYWLSSLIVAAASGSIGLILYFDAKRELAGKARLPNTRKSLDRAASAVQDKMYDIKLTTRGGNYGIRTT